MIQGLLHYVLQHCKMRTLIYIKTTVMNVNTLDIYLCPRFYATQLQKSENLIKKLTDIYIHIQINTGRENAADIA